MIDRFSNYQLGQTTKSCPGSHVTSRWKFSSIFYFVFFVDLLVDPVPIFDFPFLNIFETARILQKKTSTRSTPELQTALLL